MEGISATPDVMRHSWRYMFWQLLMNGYHGYSYMFLLINNGFNGYSYLFHLIYIEYDGYGYLFHLIYNGYDWYSYLFYLINNGYRGYSYLFHLTNKSIKILVLWHLLCKSYLYMIIFNINLGIHFAFVYFAALYFIFVLWMDMII